MIDRFPAVTLESAGCDQSRGKWTTAVLAVRAFSPVVSFSNRRDARFPSQPRRLTTSNAGDTTGPARSNKTGIPAGMPAASAKVLAHLRRAIVIIRLIRGYRSCLAPPPATGCHPSGMDTVGPMFSNGGTLANQAKVFIGISSRQGDGCGPAIFQRGHRGIFSTPQAVRWRCGFRGFVVEPGRVARTARAIAAIDGHSRLSGSGRVCYVCRR